MVTPALKAHFESQGVALLPLELGAKMFVDELRGAPGQATEVVIGGELPALRVQSKEFGIIVDEAHYPFVGHHKIQGVAVVPVALVLEWFYRAARAMGAASVRELKVLRGIKLPLFGESAERLRLRGDRQSDMRIKLELWSSDNKLLYSAFAAQAGGARVVGFD